MTLSAYFTGMEKPTDFEQLRGLLWRFVIQFPLLAHTLYLQAVKVSVMFASMSPKTKEQAIKLLSFIQYCSIAIYTQLTNIYPTIMSFGHQELENWCQPHDYILTFISSVILFILPMSEQWDIESEKALYISHGNTINLDYFSASSLIYKKTTQWPRMVVDPLHFRIPFWKHILVFLGAVKDKQGIITELSKTGCAILMFPQRYDIDEIEIAKKQKGYTVIPFATAGIEKMFLKVMTVSINPRNLSQTISMYIPVSYQRQYATFGSDYKKGTFQEDLVELYKMTSDRMDADEGRFLLQSVGSAIFWVRVKFFQSGGVVHKIGNVIFSVGSKVFGTLGSFIVKKLQAVGETGVSDRLKEE